jgi:hypothetical protein
MQFSPELGRKLEHLQREFGDLNLRSDDVVETVSGIAEHMLRNGRGSIPIAVCMISEGLGLLYAECNGDTAAASELFDIIANRSKEEMGK